MSEHIHLLVSLGHRTNHCQNSYADKGDSSFWVNKQQLIRNKFEWQDEYIALSVSYSAIDKVRAYISSQEEHQEENFCRRIRRVSECASF